MGREAPPKVKYQIIDETINRSGNMMNISWLCDMAGVSRSGYYAWMKAKPKREAREKEDENDFKKILEAFRYRYPKGARGIYMRLLHEGERMNLKKIRRLMRKYGLICPFRKPNPYKKIARELKTSTIAPNIVHRHFTAFGVRKVLLTDITYLYYGDSQVCYLSTIIDAVTHEVLAWKLSDSFRVDFVIDTVDSLIKKHGAELDDWAIVHSDQGCHYTSKAFIEKLKDANYLQSMSRKGNCWDNAPQESFFGHMKDEIRYEVKQSKSVSQVNEKLEDWMDYYNNERYQWDILKLSPVEFYKYKTTGYYPLEKYEKVKVS